MTVAKWLPACWSFYHLVSLATMRVTNTQQVFMRDEWPPCLVRENIVIYCIVMVWCFVWLFNGLSSTFDCINAEWHPWNYRPLHVNGWWQKCTRNDDTSLIGKMKPYWHGGIMNHLSSYVQQMYFLHIFKSRMCLDTQIVRHICTSVSICNMSMHTWSQYITLTNTFDTSCDEMLGYVLFQL